TSTQNLFPYTTLFRSHGDRRHRGRQRCRKDVEHTGMIGQFAAGVTSFDGGGCKFRPCTGTGSLRGSQAREQLFLPTRREIPSPRSEEHTSELQSRENL